MDSLVIKLSLYSLFQVHNFIKESLEFLASLDLMQRLVRF